MKKLLLVGESPPFQPWMYDEQGIALQDGFNELNANLAKVAYPVVGANRPDLMPLDVRHGVFPNHVMTPFLATLIAVPHNEEIRTCIESALNDNSSFGNIFTHQFPSRLTVRGNDPANNPDALALRDLNRRFPVGRSLLA